MRWFDDLAVVVTFRQVDPLYIVDLSDPGQPRLLRRAEPPRLLLGTCTRSATHRVLGVGPTPPTGHPRAAAVPVSDAKPTQSVYPQPVDPLQRAKATLFDIADPRTRATFTWTTPGLVALARPAAPGHLAARPDVPADRDPRGVRPARRGSRC